jgi:Leucine-rich repeat (LRR) protein
MSQLRFSSEFSLHSTWCILLVLSLQSLSISSVELECIEKTSSTCSIENQIFSGADSSQVTVKFRAKNDADTDDIKNVEIKNCELLFVPLKAIGKTFEKLENLEIQNCLLTEFLDNETDSRDLRKLTVKESNITDIKNESFVGWSKLETLVMSNCEIAHIKKLLQPGTFDSIENLKELDFQSNSIKVLPDKLFSNNKKLEKVNFANNQIEKIRNELFGDPSKLVNLNFARNHINSIGETLYQKLSSATLDLTENACYSGVLNNKQDAKKDLNNCFLRYRLDDSIENVYKQLDEFAKSVEELQRTAHESTSEIGDVNKSVISAGAGIGGLVIFVMGFVVMTIFKSRKNKVAPAEPVEVVTAKPIVTSPSIRNKHALVRVESSSESSSSSSDSESECERKSTRRRKQKAHE